MNVIKLQEIKTNYVPNLEVYLDDKFLLFYPYTYFSAKLKHILINTDIRVLYSEGNFVNLEELVDDDETVLEDSFTILAHSAKAQIKFVEAFNKLKTIFSRVPTEQKFVYEDLNTFIYSDILSDVHNAPHAYLAISEFYVDSVSIIDKYIANILKNLFFMLASLEIDQSNTFPSLNRRVQLAMSALLLDIGILPVIHQLEAENKPTAINIRSPKIIPIIAKMGTNIYRHSFVPHSLSLIIEATQSLMTNPNKPLDSSMQESAKYIFTNLAYTHLIVNTIQKNINTPTKALTLMLQNAKFFSPKFVKALTYTLGHAPHGSYVRLKNNNYGMVVESQFADLKNPLVHIIVGTKGELKIKPTVVSTASIEYALDALLTIEESKELIKKRKLILNNIPINLK